MATVEVVKTERMPDGTEYRATMELDEGDGGDAKPEDEGAWPILSTQYVAGQGEWRAAWFDKDWGPRFIEAYNRLAGGNGNGYPYEAFERWLKIFRGVTLVRTYDSGLRTYIAFDLPEWREFVGITADQDVAKEAPLYEVKAWLENDVWAVHTERRWNPDNELGDEDGWHDVSSGQVWGLYGRTYSRAYALESLAAEVKHHKPIHRYREHEKLDKVSNQAEIILGYLESLHTWGLMPQRLVERARAAARVADEHAVHRYLGIDPLKIEQERKLMEDRRRKAQEAREAG